MERLYWVAEVNQKVENMIADASNEAEKWKKLSIYKVPAVIKGRNEKAYTPQIVSLGPYHHGEAHLSPMEKHKQRALAHFLRRSKKPLEAFVDSVAEVVEELKDSYDELDPSWKDERSKFLELMILDGIFLLEVLRTAVHGLNDDDYAQNDPIFSRHGKLQFRPLILPDMLMFENQLPLLVLVKLVAVDSNNPEDKYEALYSLLVTFFCLSPTTSASNIGKSPHILDVYRKILVLEVHPPSCKIELDEGPKNTDKILTIPSATNLHRAGILFEKSKTSSLKNISFENYYNFRLPRIQVGHATEPLFMNLIAFEQLHVEAGSEVTSYIAFMSKIIKDAKHVGLLTSKGIIINTIGDNQKVAELFNSLPKDIAFESESNLATVCKRINGFCKVPGTHWKATLRLYPEFSDPVKMVSFFITYFLFPLTLLQTAYTIAAYYQSLEKP